MRISCNAVFFKSQNPRKAGTLCIQLFCDAIGWEQNKKNVTLERPTNFKEAIRATSTRLLKTPQPENP